jgi:hypothetical protein
MIAPKDESRELVMKWLNSKGLGENASLSPRTDSIIVQASVSQIEKLLDAEYAPFGEPLFPARLPGGFFYNSQLTLRANTLTLRY